MSLNHKPNKPTSLRSACSNLLARIPKQQGSPLLQDKPPVRKFAIVMALIIVVFIAITAAWNSYESQFRYDPALHYKVKLTTDSMSQSELNEAMPALEERLSIFAGEGNYGIEDTASGMNLILPKEAFHNQNITTTVEMLLTNPSDLYLVNINPEDSTEYRKVKLEDSDIEDLKISHGRIDGLNPIEYGIEEAEYDYLKFGLSDSIEEKMRYELSGSWDDNYYIAQDAGSDVTLSYLFRLYSSKDEGYYRVLLASGSSNFLNTAIHNWKGSHIHSGIKVVENYEQNADWQKISEIVNPGELQKSRTAITAEDSIVVAFRTTGMSYTPGDVFNIENELKARFDAIGQPYAFGTYSRFGRTYMVIKTSASRMGKPVYNVLTASSTADLCAGSACATVNLSNMSATVVPSSDSYFKLRVSTNYEPDTGKVAHLKEYALSYDEKNYLLSLSRGYIMTGSTKGTTEDSRIEFDTLCNTKATKITLKNRWIADLIAEIINSDTVISPVEFVGDSSSDDIEAGISDFDTNRYAAEIKKIRDSGGIKAVTTDGQYMEIVLDIKPGDDMPDKFAGKVREIMKIVDFGKSSLRCVSIYPEIPDKSEKTGVEISKNIYTCYDSLYSLWGSKYSVDVLVSGDYEPYSYEIRSLMDQFSYDEMSDRY